MLLHFDVGRAVSIQALDQAVELGSYIFLVPQKELAVEDPELKDLYAIGTIAAVRQVLRLPGDNVRVMVEGITRARAVECWQDKPYLVLQVEPIEEDETEHHSARAVSYTHLDVYKRQVQEINPSGILRHRPLHRVCPGTADCFCRLQPPSCRQML